MLVIMDAKRGDIGSTSTPVQTPGLAMTLHFQAMPDDKSMAWHRYARTISCPADAAFSGLFVLNRTSNDGAGDLQDQMVDGARFILIL